MEPRDPSTQQATKERRLVMRFALAAIIAVLALGTAASLAFARGGTKQIGTGVVVIDTKLAYGGGEAAGTGVVLTSTGEVLTNNHVIRGASTITIVIPGTGRSYRAKVVGYDVSADVAVLEAVGASDLKTVALGNSARVEVGQTVKAVGNAGGTGSLASARGTVTAIARAITVSDEQGGSERLVGLIETNADVVPGDSGGPLLNAAGRAIGIDTAASAAGYGYGQSADTTGYAIPINKALAIANRIESGKSSAAIHVGGTALLGVQIMTNGSSGGGALIAGVEPGTPAAAAGLQPGDLITAFAGHAISSPAQLSSRVLAARPGQRVKVTYVDRGGASHTTIVKLANGAPQ
jgi:S1-C subfamily serine protease